MAPLPSDRKKHNENKQDESINECTNTEEAKNEILSLSDTQFKDTLKSLVEYKGFKDMDSLPKPAQVLMKESVKLEEMDNAMRANLRRNWKAGNICKVSGGEKRGGSLNSLPPHCLGRGQPKSMKSKEPIKTNEKTAVSQRRSVEHNPSTSGTPNEGISETDIIFASSRTEKSGLRKNKAKEIRGGSANNVENIETKSNENGLKQEELVKVKSVEQTVAFIQGGQKSTQANKQHSLDEGGGSKSSKKKHSKSNIKEAVTSTNCQTPATVQKNTGDVPQSPATLFEDVLTSAKEKEGEVVLRNNKNTSGRTRERLSWDDIRSKLPELPDSPVKTLSVEDLGSSTDWKVSKSKKRNKKRANRSSSARRNSTNTDERKATKILSQDSSISSTANGKITEKKKMPEKPERPQITYQKERSPPFATEVSSANNLHLMEFKLNTFSISKHDVPDVHNIKSFPAITGTTTKPSTSTSTITPQNTITMAALDKSMKSINVKLDDHSISREQSTAVTTAASGSRSGSSSLTIQPLPFEISQCSGASPSGPFMPSTSNNSLTFNPAGSVSTRKGHSLNNVKMRNTNDRDNNSKAKVSIRDSMIVHKHNQIPQFKYDSKHYARSPKLPHNVMEVSVLEKDIHIKTGTPHHHNNNNNNNSHNNNKDIPGSCLQPLNTIQSSSAIDHQINFGKAKRKKGVMKMGEMSKNEQHASTYCDINLRPTDVLNNNSNNANSGGILDEQSHASFEATSQTTATSASTTQPVVILPGQDRELASGIEFGYGSDNELLEEDQNTKPPNIDWGSFYRPPPLPPQIDSRLHQQLVDYLMDDWEKIEQEAAFF